MFELHNEQMWTGPGDPKWASLNGSGSFHVGRGLELGESDCEGTHTRIFKQIAGFLKWTSLHSLNRSMCDPMGPLWTDWQTRLKTLDLPFSSLVGGYFFASTWSLQYQSTCCGILNSLQKSDFLRIVITKHDAGSSRCWNFSRMDFLRMD